MIDLGTIARKQRQQLGLSQQEVADKAICHRETVCMFENNARSVSMDIVQNIFDALGLELTVKEVQHDN